MVNFLKKRLQVFVSSTYKDLKEERQAAVEAILGAGHIPAGMELFASGDESQMKVIKQWIDQSDVYLLILGGRYGSIEPKSEKSYIQLEYEYASEKRIPLFSCVLKNPKERADRRGVDYIETEYSQKYRDFKKIVESKVVTFWSDTKDIEISIYRTLRDFEQKDNLVGWVRGNELINIAPIVTEEIARLSEENNSLRQQLNQTKEQNFVGLSYDEMKSILKKNFISTSSLEKLKNYPIYLDPDMDLLDLFWNSRKELVKGLGYYNEIDSLDELAVRGLLEIEPMLNYKGGGGSQLIYKTTLAGQEFLNRLALERLNHDDSNQSTNII